MMFLVTLGGPTPYRLETAGLNYHAICKIADQLHPKQKNISGDNLDPEEGNFCMNV